MLALAETPAADVPCSVVPTPVEQVARRAERARARATQCMDDAGEAPPPPPARFDAANPYAAGTLKSACWSALEPAGADGLAVAAIAAAVAERLPGAAATASSIVAALGQDAANFVRIAPATYALRMALPGAGMPRPRPAAPAVASVPLPAAGPNAGAAPAFPATLMALSLNELRAAFLAVVGRATKSKNKNWLRTRLLERDFCGGFASAPAECADADAAILHSGEQGAGSDA